MGRAWPGQATRPGPDSVDSPLSPRGAPGSALTRTTRSSCSDHRPIGKRSPPLVRAPPAMRSADAAHSLRARPGVEEPRAETPVFAPLRGRPRPSETETPRLPQLSHDGEPPGPRRSASPPARGGTFRAAGARRSLRKLVSRTHAQCRRCPSGDTTKQLRNRPGLRTRGNTPSTRLRG